MRRTLAIALVSASAVLAAGTASAAPVGRTALVAAGNPVRVVDERGAVLWQGPEEGVWLVWSPDGRRLAFFDDGALTVVDRTNWHVASTPPLGGPFHFPAWSPDGSRLAFTSLDDEEVYVAAPRGCCARRVSAFGEEGARAVVVDWSPGGGLVVLTSDGLVRLDPVTGATTPLTTEHAGLFDVSPVDGSLAVVAPHDGGHAVWRLDPDGSDPRVLSATVDAGFPVWSPDGRWVAFTDATGLVAVRSDGSDRRQLTTVPAASQYNPPSWFPDSRRVTYQADRHDHPAVVVGLDTGLSGVVTHGPWITGLGPVVAPAFAPRR